MPLTLGQQLRLYLYNYDVDENWPITCEHEVLGIPTEQTGMVTKAQDLRPGDIVIVHDTTYKESFRVHGACIIAGPMINQYVDDSPWDDLLWFDEKNRYKRIHYPYRFRVEIVRAPKVTHKKMPWKRLDDVPAIGWRGQAIRGPNAWSKKFRGNLLTDPREVAAMIQILGLK